MNLSAGLVYTDIGDTTFGGKADAIKANLATGVAFQYSLNVSKLTLTSDYRHILNETDWRKKIHFGMEFALPMVTLYGGLNQVTFTYGAGIDVWLFRLTVLSYSEEEGSFVHQDGMRRWVLKLALKFEL